MYFFNTGVDTATLDAQIEEKRLHKQAEDERNKACDAELVKNSQICSLLDSRQQNDTRKLNEELNKFRCAQDFYSSSISKLYYSKTFWLVISFLIEYKLTSAIA